MPSSIRGRRSGRGSKADGVFASVMVYQKDMRLVKRFSIMLISIAVGILGCGPVQTAVVTATTLPATSHPTIIVILTPMFEAPAESGPTATPVAAATNEAETLDEIPARWLTVYPIISELESVSHPPDYEAVLDERFSVDGVRVAAPRTLSIRNPAAENGFVISVENIVPEPRLETMEAQVQQDDSCVASITQEPLLLSGWSPDALIYRNTPCGPFGSTVIFAHDQYSGYTYFRVTVESHVSYDIIAPEVEAILRTFRFRRNPAHPH
jgi:hypothetical protein